MSMAQTRTEKITLPRLSCFNCICRLIDIISVLEAFVKELPHTKKLKKEEKHLILPKYQTQLHYISVEFVHEFD